MEEKVARDWSLCHYPIFAIVGGFFGRVATLMTVAVGFNPRSRDESIPRRGATIEYGRLNRVNSTVAPRRDDKLNRHRGLKPTAKIKSLLRDEEKPHSAIKFG